MTPAAKWLLAHVEYQGDDCLEWPFRERSEGYGSVRYMNKTHTAHRLMCELVHGPAPEGAVASHECGNGHEGCVNPRHLSWKSQKENWEDRRRHGVPNPSNRGRLTYAERIEIRRLRGIETQAALAKRFGVDRSTISCIQRKEPKKYRGVLRWGKRFASVIHIDGTPHNLGVFETRKEAAHAYQIKFAELLGRPTSDIST